MGSRHQFPLWFQIPWALLICGGLTYYLIRCWKRGVITPPRPAGTRTGDASRNSEPALYWWCMGIYAVFDLIMFVFLLLRIYALIKSPAEQGTAALTGATRFGLKVIGFTTC